ncbi:MAG: tripartite tricarboxylate transporter TctB family protein [Rhodobacteraceae bacterium]|nr:tripartite tricarboxylate transporter TctB family protein [Paracoccaceae bacterium]
MKHVLRSAEFGVTLALLLASVLFLVDSLKLPGGEFDPLGPGAAPEMVASVLIVLCTIVLIRSVLTGLGRYSSFPADPSATGNDAAERTPRSLILFFCLLVAYILAFQYEAAHFVAITIVFVFLATIALRGWDSRSALVSAAVAVCLSVFLFFALTRFFVIRLPGAF